MTTETTETTTRSTSNTQQSRSLTIGDEQQNPPLAVPNNNETRNRSHSRSSNSMTTETTTRSTRRSSLTVGDEQQNPPVPNNENNENVYDEENRRQELQRLLLGSSSRAKNQNITISIMPTTATVTTNTASCHLDLRQYGTVTLHDLEQLPSTLEKLWMGPYFGDDCDDPNIIIQHLPPTLTHLELDLRRCGRGLHGHRGRPNSEHYDWLMTLFLEKARKLQHLRLSVIPPPAAADDDGNNDDEQHHDGILPLAPGADQFVQHLVEAMMMAVASPQQLSSLDLRHNGIGDVGMQMLLLHGLLSSSIRYLNLSHNAMTDVSCGFLASYLERRSANVGLQSLDLSNNDNITEYGMLQVVDALSYDNSLQSLRLGPLTTRSSDGGGGADAALLVRRRLLSILKDHRNMTLYHFNLVDGTTGTAEQQQDPNNNDVISAALDFYLSLNRVGRRHWLLLQPQVSPNPHPPRKEVLPAVSVCCWPHLLANIGNGNGNHKKNNNDDDNNNKKKTLYATSHVFYFLRHVYAAGQQK